MDALHHLANGNPQRREIRDADTSYSVWVSVSDSYGDDARRRGTLLSLFSDQLCVHADRICRKLAGEANVASVINDEIAHNNNIVGRVATHERTRLGQLRQLRSPPVATLEHRSTALIETTDLSTCNLDE